MAEGLNDNVPHERGRDCAAASAIDAFDRHLPHEDDKQKECSRIKTTYIT